MKRKNTLHCLIKNKSKDIDMKLEIKETKETMNLQEFLLENYLELDEGIKYHKLSDKIKKLLEILDSKRFIKSSEDDKNALDKAELALREMLPEVKRMELAYERGNITKRQALERIRKFRTKSLAVKKYLEDKKVLSKVDWKFLISTGLSIIFLPLVFARTQGLIDVILPRPKG